ncbi:MAG: hypothetical protein L0H96_03935, partial [Humibacillus sp.]|nr:hypothetical protein [Humibacillus sp.]MDN5776041.1 hypothetical protein [Humibacillus sp.]
MNIKGSLLERLRQQLADFESSQRAAGGAATARFWSTPSPDAAEPAPMPAPASGSAGATGADSVGSVGAAGAGSVEGATSGSAGASRPSRVFPEPLTIHWGNWSKVSGAYASGFAFVAASLHRSQMQPDRMSEPDLIESVTQLGAVQHHREVNLVRIVTQLEARGVASPGGLSRVDWLRQVDPTLTASAAKAVVTCAAAFNQPRWALLREAVTGETSTDSTDSSNDGSDGGEIPESTPKGAGENQPGRVTVGKAAQVIDFHTRLKPVADPDDLDQAVAHL